MLLKRLSLLVIAFVVLLALAACGGTDNAAPTNTAVPPTSAPATDVPPTDVPPTTAPESTTAADVTAEAVAADATVEASADATAESSADAGTNTAASGVTAQVSFPSTAARSGPGTTFAQIQQVTVNQTFNVIAKTGEGSSTWYLVDLGEGQLGWLWSRVVNISPADAAVEVAATVPAP
ncbi:MAG: SH3 domain-containing protein [Anaerolineae bacterium]